MKVKTLAVDWKCRFFRYRRAIWRIIAAVLGLFAAYLALHLIGALFLTRVDGRILRDHILHGPVASSSHYPLVAGRETILDVFIYGYPLVVGVCFAYGFWQGVPSEWRRTLLYLVVFLVIGPLTLINYAWEDQLLRIDVQVLLNLFTAFFGYLVVRRVLAINTSSLDGAALQSIAILSVSALFIVMPLFYSAVFSMVLFGWIDHTGAQSIGNHTALGFSGFVGVVAGLLNLRSSLRSE